MNHQVVSNNEVNVEKFKAIFQSILSEDQSLNTQEWNNENFAKGDDVDQFNLERDRALMLRLKGRNSVYFKKIKEAMNRIDDGTFGMCQDCGCAISEQRLMARPTASLCIQCKEEEENVENKTAGRARYSAKFEDNDKALAIKNFDTAAKIIKNDFSASA